MKIFVTAILLVAALLTTMGGQANAGVSISVGEPGFFGRVDIGNFPPPRLIYGEPIIVRRVKTWYPPIYLRVPPHHVKRWHKYCDRYGACGRPVYFIEDSWYNEVYVPRYREHYRGRHGYRRPPVPVYTHEPEYYDYRRDHRRPNTKVYIRHAPY